MNERRAVNSNSRDTDTTVGQLRDLVSEFVNDRNWQQFHRPKNLAMSIAIEAAELMEHFQWVTHQQGDQITQDALRLVDIREELADVLSYLLAMANALGIDLTQALTEKMQKNELKYPKDEFYDRYGPTDSGPPET